MWDVRVNRQGSIFYQPIKMLYCYAKVSPRPDLLPQDLEVWAYSLHFEPGNLPLTCFFKWAEEERRAYDSNCLGYACGSIDEEFWAGELTKYNQRENKKEAQKAKAQDYQRAYKAKKAMPA